MTRQEFLDKIPGIIDHKTWGLCFPKAWIDDDFCCVGYKNQEGVSSFGQVGKSWDVVYEKLIKAIAESEDVVIS